MSDRYTYRTATVFVSVGDETRVFRSIDEVPPEWRRKFESPQAGLRPKTILIADREGQSELLSGLSNPARAASGPAASAAGPQPAFSAASSQPLFRLRRDPGTHLSDWTWREIAIESALAAAVLASIAWAFS